MTSDAELQLRLDNLTRGLSESKANHDLASIFVVGLGFVALLAIEIFVFVPVVLSIARP